MYILHMLTHLEVVALGGRSDISPDQHLNYALDFPAPEPEKKKPHSSECVALPGAPGAPQLSLQRRVQVRKLAVAGRDADKARATPTSHGGLQQPCQRQRAHHVRPKRAANHGR